MSRVRDIAEQLGEAVKSLYPQALVSIGEQGFEDAPEQTELAIHLQVPATKDLCDWEDEVFDLLRKIKEIPGRISRSS